MATNRIYLGIDPGVSGAAALLDDDGIIAIYNWEEKAKFKDDIHSAITKAFYAKKKLVAVVERVSGFIGKQQPGSAMFKFGENFGYQQGVLAAEEIPFELVTPQRWQKDLHCGKQATPLEHKRALREMAQQMFPDAKVTLRNADAILIAMWAREFSKL